MQMIAVFISPEAYEDVRTRVEGDLNEQNVGDVIKELYENTLRDILDYTMVGDPFQGEEREGPCAEGQVVFCHVPGSESRYLGRAIAASLGFVRDYVQEDSWHGVLFILVLFGLSYIHKYGSLKTTKRRPS